MKEKRIYAANSGTLTCERKRDCYLIGLRRGNKPFRDPSVSIELTEFQRRNLIGFLRGVDMEDTIKKNNIREAAVMLSQKQDYKEISRAVIASFAGVSESLVSHHFGSMDNVRSMIMKEAIKRRILSIIVQGILDNHEVAKAAPDELKRSALAGLME